MAEVDMEKLTIPLHHDVTRVSISDSEDVGRNKVGRTRSQIILFGKA